MTAIRIVPRLLLGMVAASVFPGRTSADDPKPFDDEKYEFAIQVPAPWAEAPTAQYTVPGLVRPAWSGPAGASIVTFVQEPGKAFSPRFLVDESAKAMKEKLGCTVKIAEVKTVDGKKAMWLVANGPGTGGALDGQGVVETSSHWVAIPREKDIVVILLTCPAADYDERLPSFEAALKTMKVKGEQTPEQADAN